MTGSVYTAVPARARAFRVHHVAWIGQVSAFAGDLLSITFAFWMAYVLRYTAELGGDVLVSDRQPLSTFERPILIALMALIVLFPIRGMYRTNAGGTFLDIAPQVIGGFTTVMATVVMLAFFLQFNPSRLIFLYVWLIGCALMLGHRLAFDVIKRSLWRRGLGVQRVLVLGAGDTGRRIMQAMSDSQVSGYRLVGYAAEESGQDFANVASASGVSTFPRLGRPDDLGNLVRAFSIDEVIILPSHATSQDLMTLTQQCRELVVQFRVVPDILQFSLDRVTLAELGGVPLIGIKDASIRGWSAIAKRAIDITLSVLVLVLAAIPMLIMAIVIRRDSPGSVIYRQQRIGKGGRPFELLKFRCMTEHADALWESMVAEHQGADERLFKLQNDPRVTRSGRWLRRYSLDELPQLLQVLAGTMSLIGPRPPLPREVEGYDDWHRQRLLVKPGLTGLWQVNGRSSLSFDEMVRLDLFYAENWTPWLDAKILLRTVPAVLRARGAY